MPADRLELDVGTILEGISEESRKDHASQVLTAAVTELREHEVRKPIAALIEENIRALSKVEVRLAEEKPEHPLLGMVSFLGGIPTRVVLSVVIAILTAVGAALGVQFDLMPILGDE